MSFVEGIAIGYFSARQSEPAVHQGSGTAPCRDVLLIAVHELAQFVGQQGTHTAALPGSQPAGALEQVPFEGNRYVVFEDGSHSRKIRERRRPVKSEPAQ
jgi:hypothetical protein